MNPVLTRELRERFRRRRAGVFVTVWLLLLAAFGYLIYLGATSFARGIGDTFFEPGGFEAFGVLASASVGRNMFEFITFLLLSAVLLVVPGVAALAVVGEKERLTLPLLQVSQLSPGSIVLGKLGSSLAYLVILVIAGAPILVLPILFGGVTLWNVVAALSAIFLVAVTVGSLSIWSSARAKSTRGAVAGA